MRIYPPVAAEEALNWLIEQAKASWGPDLPDDLMRTLSPTAEAMAEISKVVLPEEVEPFSY
jgi:hypothetical protein